MEETLVVTTPRPCVALVTLDRPKKLNAVNLRMYQQIGETFSRLGSDPDIRVIVLTGSERSFCAGMDLSDLSKIDVPYTDPARKALAFMRILKDLQTSLNQIEDCGKPVIAAVSGYCIGAGADIISACDIRYCSKNTTFSVKEVAIGMAADIGSLQRLPKVVGNNSWLREMVYTGRNATGKEALENGVFSKLYDTHAETLAAALELAGQIAEKSPIAVIGSKRVLDYSRDHSVKEGLEYVATWNGFATQSPDFINAIVAQMQKKKIEFPRL